MSAAVAAPSSAATTGPALFPVIVAIVAHLRHSHAQGEVAKDISFRLSGDYITPAGEKAHLTAAPDGPLGRLTLGGSLGGAPLSGFAQNAHVTWTKYGHGEHDTTGPPGLCPGDPPGPNGCGGGWCQCGWTIGCPILPGHQGPVSCLAPSPGRGCAPVAEGVIPQCVWANVSDAKQYCGEWEQCEGFHCQRVAKTDPSGCGDCPQPAGSWCKCTIQTTCQARGTGTKLSGGGTGDATDYAYIKTGNLTGWLLLPQRAIKNGSTEPQNASRSTELGHTTAPGCHLRPGAPKQYKALCEAQTSESACM
eukprot:COSAG05_NODE_339_length_11118_cov_3.752246_10_plen_305_part_01